MNPHVTMSTDPRWVLAQAGDYLAAEPVLHNLVLTLLHERVAAPVSGRYWIVADGDAVIGVGFQSPLTFPLLLTPMPRQAVFASVDAIAEAGIVLPGVSAEAATAAYCAGQWSERTSLAASPIGGLRIYECAAVAPGPAVPGRLRRAMAADRELLIGWTGSFFLEVGEVGHDLEAMVDERLAAGRCWVWEHGEPVSMAVHSAPLAKVARVQNVYTPTTMRGRGYAGACVGRVTHLILEGESRCMLYTDLGNPTSNSIYRRIGYRSVAEGLRYRFANPAPPEQGTGGPFKSC
jgi:ribosomal protein S18 acetylase RimI-like enzyme